MTVKELIEQLKRQNPSATVYFRDNAYLKAVSKVRVNPVCDSFVELTNPECEPR